MSIIKNFRNPWEDDNWVLQTDVLDTSVLGTDVLNNDVLKPPTTNIGRGTHFYDDKGNILYKSRYGERAITIVFEEYIEYIKNLERDNEIVVEGIKEEIDENYVKILRKNYGRTYLISSMLEISEKSKTDKRTQYNPRNNDGGLKYPHYVNSRSHKLLSKQPPVEVACPLYLNGYGEVEVGDYESELAIGNDPLTIDSNKINSLKKSYQLGFVHTETIVGLKNVAEARANGIFPCSDYNICQSPSNSDISDYIPTGDIMKIIGYHSVIIRPYTIIFFKSGLDYFCIEKKYLP